MDCDFELTEIEVKGLKALNNEISEDVTKKVIVNAVKQLLVKGPALPARSDIYDSPFGLEAKQADFAICAVLLLAAKHSTDSISLQQLLNHHKINNKTIEQIIESYEKFKQELSSRLSKQGNSHNIPHLSSVSVEVQQASNEISYKINLQSFDQQAGKNRKIQEMFCNQEELQMLINKLKDIERHCEKISK